MDTGPGHAVTHADMGRGPGRCLQPTGGQGPLGALCAGDAPSPLSPHPLRPCPWCWGPPSTPSWIISPQRRARTNKVQEESQVAETILGSRGFAKCTPIPNTTRSGSRQRQSRSQAGQGGGLEPPHARPQAGPVGDAPGLRAHPAAGHGVGSPGPGGAPPTETREMPSVPTP